MMTSKECLNKIQHYINGTEIFIRNVYYDNHNHCVKMREIRKSRFNFDYEDLILTMKI